MRLATLSEKEIIITLIALALLLIMAFVFGSLMELIKGPRVVGEIRSLFRDSVRAGIYRNLGASVVLGT